jgi:cardiolipin synthase (CMP-forming)
MYSSPQWLNLPNAVSLLRLPLAALFVVADSTVLRLGVVAVAGFSDWLDGRLARSAGRTTRAGELLDPVADRIFMAAALLTLVLERQLPLWTLPLLLLRDIGVMVGAVVVLAVNRHARLAARRAGKGLTWLQFAAVALLLFRSDLALLVIVPIVVLSLVALVDYARHWHRAVR